MKTKDILEAMSKGAILCMGYEGFEKVYWLEPRRVIIRSDQAEQLIPMLQPSKDGFFEDSYSQTWKAKR